MKIQFELQWNLGIDALKSLDSSVFTLLHGIQDGGSLQESCRRAGLSYRHAWGLLNEWAATLGQPLVELKRGRGSQLTPLGSALIAARQQVESRFANEFSQVAAELAQTFSNPAPTAVRHWKVFASHDLALLKTRDLISRACGVELEIEIHGSHDCLNALARRGCNMAGFHLSGDETPEIWLRNALGRTPNQPIRLIEFAKRDQGLMLRSGLDKEIKSIVDLARSGARFINRQRGSGTRTLFDRLLKDNQLRPTDIRGYHDEEFTHLAVAATVAGGGADAAFGIRAAAVQFGLPFIPLERETYYLACREELSESEHISKLGPFFQSSEFREICATLPGYDTSHSGSESLIETRRIRKTQRRHL